MDEPVFVEPQKRMPNRIIHFSKSNDIIDIIIKGNAFFSFRMLLLSLFGFIPAGPLAYFSYQIGVPAIFSFILPVACIVGFFFLAIKSDNVKTHINIYEDYITINGKNYRWEHWQGFLINETSGKFVFGFKYGDEKYNLGIWFGSIDGTAVVNFLNETVGKAVGQTTIEGDDIYI